jgi:hypothetical protein
MPGETSSTRPAARSFFNRCRTRSTCRGSDASWPNTATISWQRTGRPRAASTAHHPIGEHFPLTAHGGRTSPADQRRHPTGAYHRQLTDHPPRRHQAFQLAAAGSHQPADPLHLSLQPIMLGPAGCLTFVQNLNHHPDVHPRPPHRPNTSYSNETAPPRKRRPAPAHSRGNAPERKRHLGITSDVKHLVRNDPGGDHGAVSQFFEDAATGETLWNPATRVAQLFWRMTEAMVPTASGPCEITQLPTDVYAVDPDVFTAFVDALVSQYFASNHPIFRAMLVGYLPQAVVMVERSGRTVATTTVQIEGSVEVASLNIDAFDLDTDRRDLLDRVAAAARSMPTS